MWSFHGIQVACSKSILWKVPANLSAMVRKAINKMSLGKAAGPSGNVAEMLKAASSSGPLLFVIVLEALFVKLHTGCPWKILYADDLMVSAQSMDEWLVKLRTWRSELEKKGLKVNMGKTKLMVSGSNVDVLRKSRKYPCGVCRAGVGRKAIQCGGCRQWGHKKCSGIKGPLTSDLNFRCTRCLGTARPVDGRLVKEVMRRARNKDRK